ncbi:MAG: hypothetical protein EXQ71_07425 [Acidimicrobiia bacterium]|nr:hypothetical protein [Acidimicrobiia bacterium]
MEPSPAQGDDFDMTFTFNFVLPKNLTEVAVETGYTELVVTGGGAISPTEGAVGETAILTDTVTVQLGDGSVAVGFTIGPQSFPYTRTAAPGEPIVFTPNQILSETPIVTGLLKMICYPPDEELILNDQIGVAPIATTTTLQALVPTTAGPPATVKGTTDDAEVAALPRTGSGTSNLYLVLLALGLLDVGYLALTADNSRTRRASSVR